MDLERLFWIAHLPALVGWIALLAAPLVGAKAIIIARGAGLILAIFYLACFLAAPDGLQDLARDYSLDGVGALFADPRLMLLGWIHYLAFDLFTGMWIARDADQKGFSRAVQFPFLLLTLLVGPVGLFAWLIVRERRARARAKGK